MISGALRAKTDERMHIGRESAVAAAGALAVTLAALRVNGAWTRGVIGDRDAWQNVWNIDHVDRALRLGKPLLFSDRVWAPEGASLLAHTLSLTNTLPGALLSRAAGLCTAYNALVVFSFLLAAVTLYRLARRMGASRAGAAVGAAVFAFCPQRFARALGHMNLLGIGWLPLALECLWVSSRARGIRGVLAAAGAGAALVALAFTDWYLAVLAVLAAGALFVFELLRSDRPRAVLVSFGVAALVAVPAVAPYALALRAESAAHGTEGHEAQWCSTALTSLLVPSRIQLVSRVTAPLTERNHQNISEAAGYLGLVPLAAMLWVACGRRRERALDFALLAGGAALLLALGPRVRVFDSLLAIPLPYALVERLLPALKLGGCVNRYIALAFLPLALGTAFAVTRLLATRRPAARAAVVAGIALLAAEYAPVSPGVAVAPYTPADPAMLAIARSPLAGAVLDLDVGADGLVRQLRHGRPQLLGYISRTPPESWKRRVEDPVLGPLLDPSLTAFPVPPAAAGALLRRRWGAAFVVTSDAEPFRARARSLGFPLAETRGDALVYAIPREPLAPVERFELTDTADPARAPSRGVFAWGFGAPETFTSAAGSSMGRWASPGAGLLAPLSPARYALALAARGPTRVTVRWGNGKELARTVTGSTAFDLDVAPADLADDNTLLVSISPRTFPAGAAIRDEVFVTSLARR